MSEQYKFSDLTGKIIGAAMEVHNHLGNGFQEVVYQRALSIEMRLRDIVHEREKEMPLTYKGFNIGTRRADFFVDEKIMVGAKLAFSLLSHIRKARTQVKKQQREPFNRIAIVYDPEKIGVLRPFLSDVRNFARVENVDLVDVCSFKASTETLLVKI